MKISCIDIGGTYIKSGVLEDGVLTDVEETPTDGGGGARAMLSRVAQLVRQTPGVERVGVSTAGEVDARTGVIRLSDNIPGYTGLNPRQILEGELGLPVAVENDVNAAAAGEFAFGAARDEQDFLMVSYGTGVGGAVYTGGRLYRGRAGSAGEFGGLVTHPEAVDPARQGTGSYERYASTSALVARVTALYPALTTGRDIFAHLNDPTIKKEVDAWIREVACGIISLIHAFDPALVVLGGGYTWNPEWAPSSNLINNSLPRLTEGIRLWQANPGSKMIFTGAAAKTNPVSTAEAGARVAESLGVPRSDIIVLDRPKDTEEEALAVKRAIGDAPFLLVTSASHLPRAMIFFRHAGLDPLPAPANQLAVTSPLNPWERAIPSPVWLMHSDRVGYETLGRVWQWLKGSSGEPGQE